jgi:hypothetical protein
MTEINHKKQNLSKILAGLFIILFGLMILLDQLDFEIPDVLKSWELILIGIGVVILVKHSFRNLTGYILIIIGVVLILNDYYPELIQMRLIWPIIIMLFGASILIKAFSGNKESNRVSKMNQDDFFESSTIFGSVSKKHISNDFKGATITTIFGSSEFDLTQCNISDVAIIDLTSLFSGVTLKINQNWEIKSELTTVFGGIDNKSKKGALNMSENENKKTLILKGSCIFGGIDIIES